MRTGQIAIVAASLVALVACRARLADGRVNDATPALRPASASDAPERLVDLNAAARVIGTLPTTVDRDYENPSFTTQTSWRFSREAQHELSSDWRSVLEVRVDVLRSGMFVLALEEARSNGKFREVRGDPNAVVSKAPFVREAGARAGDQLHFAIQLTRDGNLHFEDPASMFRVVTGDNDAKLPPEFLVSARGEIDTFWRPSTSKTFDQNAFDLVSTWVWDGWLSGVIALGEKYSIPQPPDVHPWELPSDIANWPEPVIFLLAGVFDVDEKR